MSAINGAPANGSIELAPLVALLRQLGGIRGKNAIQRPAAHFPHQPFAELGPAAALGDDAALLPASSGQLLLASEGMDPDLIERDPWFAGWCGVLVNLSDIAAMGGRPLALVNSLWCREADRAEPVLAGLQAAAARFGVPVVGGHTNLSSPYDALAVAVLGTAAGPVLSARFARPGDACVLLVNTSGRMRHPDPFWDAATEADPALLRRQLALLPQLAESGAARAAKDISMGGLVGTAVMFSESSGCGLLLDLDAITPPGGVTLEAWLSCFPSFGFLLAVAPGHGEALARAVAASETGPATTLLCQPIGRFTAEPGVRLQAGGIAEILWHGSEALTGFTALAPPLGG
ncbi:sll0787 family AIR synthase-like protein [Synechococcus sp. CS-205]|uniref:sll0787 family AIR synthase-like protein n=1 Tax=Synechococcus sp. CS-205 TaxID=2847984 RepID=UPI00223C4EFD|nr:sll0787 family AIR synthase-like protein [Synechococcus sp. CS-205]MCT0248759.1 sll0787 family AIR synthase-like protein [Synechococcus sp. CS-205]